MTDERPDDVTQEPSGDAAASSGETVVPEMDDDALSAADAALEERLAEPVFKGEQGIDAAQVWIAAFLVVVVGAIAYSNSLSAPFHYEDQLVIRDNTALHAPISFAEALGVDRTGGPLTMLTFAVNWWFTGGSPTAFHVVNVFIHLLNGVLLFLVCRRILGKGVREPVAMVAGMLFVLHPANTESVNYIVGRSGELALAMALGSLLLFLRAVRDDDGIRGWALGASLLLFVLARACEWTALSLPAIVLLVDAAVNGGRPLMKRLWVHGLYWGLLVVLVAARSAAQSGPPTVSDPGFMARMSGMANYFMLSVSPGGLSVVHPAPWDGPALLGILLVGGLAVATLLLAARRLPVAAATGWFLVALAPAWVALANPGVLAERFLYLPLAGACLLLPALFAAGLKEGRLRAIGGIVLAAVVIVAGIGTFARNRVWRDEAALWTDAAAKAPDSPTPMMRLAALSCTYGDASFSQAMAEARARETAAASRDREQAQLAYEDAEQFLRAALERSPENGEALTMLGRVLERLGKTDEAVDVLKRALQTDTTSIDCTAQLAALLHTLALTTGDPDSRLAALDYYARLDKLGGLTTDLRVQYANLLLSVGNLPLAEQVLVRAGELPDDSPAARQLAEVRRVMNETRQAEMRAQSLMQSDPANLNGVLMSARALVGLGKDLDAAYLLHSVLKDRPGEGAVWSLLGFVKARMGQAQSFIAEYGASQPFSMDSGNPWEALARTCAASGLWSGAQTYLECDPARASGVTLPLMRMGALAEELGQAQLAGRYYEEAANAYPDEAAPVVRLCEFAVGSKNAALAQRLLEESRKRGADAGTLERLAKQVGDLGESAPAGDGTAVMQ